MNYDAQVSARSSGFCESLAVIQRHSMAYRRNWLALLLPPLVQPILLFLAIGFGLGRHVGTVAFAGDSVSYANYIAPGLLAMALFNGAFAEATYLCFGRLVFKRFPKNTSGTPIGAEHIFWGELLWCALMATFQASCLLLCELALFAGGFLQLRWDLMLLCLPLFFMFSLIFAALAMAFTARARVIEALTIPLFALAFPLSFTSDTFFPLRSEFALALHQLNPLYHLVQILRYALLRAELPVWQHLCIPLAEGLVALFFVRRRMVQRIASLM